MPWRRFWFGFVCWYGSQGVASRSFARTPKFQRDPAELALAEQIEAEVVALAKL
jgi:hypothetical protein